MSINFVARVMQRKERPVHPGSIIMDIFEERGMCIGDFYSYSIELDEILEEERPMTYYWAKEFEDHLGISADLLMNLQRKVDIWESTYE